MFFTRALVIGAPFFGGSMIKLDIILYLFVYLLTALVILVSFSPSLSSNSLTIPLMRPFEVIFRLQVSNLKSRKGINTNLVALSIHS